MSKKIAIQGELGAYSHIAAENLYAGAEIKTCTTFEETFKQAYNDQNYKIVIPIENSLAGRVADIHYLLPKYKLQIHGEYFQTVEHNLLCKQDATIDDIKYVRSHAQAIGQCQNIINKRKFKSIVSADTAGSAKELAEGKDKSIAAIASELSAKIYNLKILEKNIEDEKGNVTRFLIMGKKIEQPEFKSNKNYITSCIFRVKSEPSALYKCLGGFATNQVNLTKLESFSVKNTFDQANFYLDLEGHLEQPGVKKALELNIKPKFVPFCYVPKEILEAVTLNNPYKRDYLMEDCKRLFNDLNIDLVSEIPADCNWPSVHAAWSEVNKEDKGLEFMLKIFEARFKKGLNVGDKNIITNICNEISISSEFVLSAMDNEDIDKDLKSLTKIMRELKVFGVPTFIYKKERFWGQDRLHYLKDKLNN